MEPQMNTGEWNWWTGQQPQQVVYPYAGPDPAPTCN